MGEQVVTETSDLASCRAEVWARVTSPTGINHELAPILKMTTPPGVGSLDLDSVSPGQNLGRSWLLLGGLLPVDADDITIAEIEREEHFLERSTMLTMRSWEHERTLADVPGGTRVSDTLRFHVRVPGTGGLARALVGSLFRHRHRRLRRHFGEVTARP